VTREEDPGNRSPNFKTCTCGTPWKKRHGFLADPSIRLVGYQVHFKQLELGLFLFNHLSCGTTLTLPAESFLDLGSGPVYSDRRTGEEDCPAYCLRVENLSPCPAKCECAYIRDVLQVILGWPKRE